MAQPNPFVHGDKYMRFFGGSPKENPIDPYLTGWHYMFISMPGTLINFITADAADSAGNENDQPITQPEEILNIHNLSLTPPATTLNKATMNSIGGFKWSVPTNMDIGDNITVRYNEYSGLPIYRIHKGWVDFIRNTNLGISNSNEASNLYQTDYKATIIYATTRPDGESIEFCSKFTGVFPTKIPTDSFASDIATSDKLEIDIEYSIDFMYDNNKEVIEQAKALISDARAKGVAYNDGRPSTNRGGI